MAEEQLIPDPPRKEDVLFQSGFEDWHNNACLNFSYGNDIGYTEGYRRGAYLLVEYVNEHGRDQDFLLYPIVFLYRHHIELALKAILRDAPYVLDRRPTPAEIKHSQKHRLDLLWQDVKPIFDDVAKAAGWNTLARNDKEGIDSCIRQLTELDPDSMSFRYSRSKEGSPLLPAELTCFNLRHFAELMEKLAEYLDSLNMALSVLRDAKAEMKAQWQMEMGSYGDW